jgi:hypothetical protein
LAYRDGRWDHPYSARLMPGIELNWQCWQLNCNELKSAMPAIGNIWNWQYLELAMQ